MQIKNPDTRRTLDALQAECREKQTAFETARDAVALVAEQVKAQNEAAEAAEAAALVAKQQASTLLREVMGKPSKQLLNLRADERAAYSLAEDYRSFANELATQEEVAKLQAHETASAYRQSRKNLLDSYASAMLAQVLEDDLAPLLHAMKLREGALERQEPFAPWSQLGFETAADAVLAEVMQALKHRLAGFAFDAGADPVLSAVTPPAGLSSFPNLSAAEQHFRHTRHAKQQEAQA